ncbi:MAG: hypothetical protein UV38_C0002G0121 [candidate division TM6 bacterium GW2011_GWE2_42_60]|nr:MAG: hypothetical protein UV38_C0002G0121 [candidate division TM6 bacterium GW2011_GWE2_42_60]
MRGTALVGFEDRHECVWLHNSRFAKQCESEGERAIDVIEAEIFASQFEFSAELESELVQFEFLELRK